MLTRTKNVIYLRFDCFVVVPALFPSATVRLSAQAYAGLGTCVYKKMELVNWCHDLVFIATFLPETDIIAGKK